MQIRRRLAIVYAFVGWHCFGVIFYFIMRKQVPEDSEEKRASYRLLSGASNMHVYQVTGTTLTSDFDIAYKAKVEEIEKETREKH